MVIVGDSLANAEGVASGVMEEFEVGKVPEELSSCEQRTKNYCSVEHMVVELKKLISLFCEVYFDILYVLLITLIIANVFSSLYSMLITRPLVVLRLRLAVEPGSQTMSEMSNFEGVVVYDQWLNIQFIQVELHRRGMDGIASCDLSLSSSKAIIVVY
ncbi:unnamed protein product [Lupinus luteus]|uniref:Uncharacterized protein n=1 Tax=Lupinus luteus TaxID=3873 RepID=A0AAV1WX67_LUPLU